MSGPHHTHTPACPCRACTGARGERASLDTGRMLLSLSPELLQGLAALAKQQGRSRSSLVREALRNLVNRNVNGR